MLLLRIIPSLLIMVYLLVVINPQSIYASSDGGNSTSDSGPSDTSEDSGSDSGPSDTSDSGPSDTSDDSNSDDSNSDDSNSDDSDDSNQIDNLVERYISIHSSADPSTIAQFSPNVLWIAQGTEVNWVNNHDIEHDIYVIDNTVSSEYPLIMGSKYVNPFGDSYQLTFDKVGNYAVYCSIHPTMSGTIYVR